MKKKPTVYAEREKLDNALYNLTRYVNFLETAFFVILCVLIFVGMLAILLGFLENNYIFLRNGVLIITISLAIYFLIMKPVLLVMYAVAKILINTEKHTDCRSERKG